MQFQIKQRVFSLGDTYDITDDQGNPVYQIKGKAFSFGNQLDLLDMSGNSLAHISQRLLSWTAEYDISVGGEDAVVVKKQAFSLFHPTFDIEGPTSAYQMVGDWTNWNYTIQSEGQTLAQIGKQSALFQDRYTVDIAEEADVPTLLCLAIVMDEVSHPDKSN